jgi:phosphatidylinositol 3-kinase
VSAQLFANSKPLTVPVSTLTKSFRGSGKWNEWLTLPIKYSELPLDAQLAITIWDFGIHADREPYGGTAVRIFDKKDCTLKRGRQKLRVWLDQTADGLEHSTTPSDPSPAGGEMDRLERLMKKQEAGDIPRVDWLDNAAFRKIESINKEMAKRRDYGHSHFLYVDFVNFEFPTVYSDIEYPPVSLLPHAITGHQRLAVSVAVLDDADRARNSSSGQARLMVAYDPDQLRENPIETMHRRLVRNHKSSQLDMDLRPNAHIRDELNNIVNYSPVQELTDDEKNLLWKFRYYLSKHERALTKFLKAISWEDPVESKQAVELLSRWAEIDVDDALELLGPTFKSPAVRAHAVERLRKASDSELALYLLQLVEALKFEYQNAYSKSDLAKFLIGRASRNSTLGNFFYWYVSVETQEKTPTTGFFEQVLKQFLSALKSRPDGEAQSAQLKQQIKLMNALMDLARSIKWSKDSRPKKAERLRAYLGDHKNGLMNFPEVPLPLDPSIKVVGCIPEESNVFKSSLSPLKVTLKTSDGSTYPIMLKSGDDLRQDQLVIQIITLMDRLLRDENLDLRLTPYRILATGPKDGSLQFIPNQTLASVLSDYHGILPYLREKAPDDSAPLGVRQDVMDTFVRSCAGYCVITYLLGVGDRHLDNLLIDGSGHFFHADFGYILGRDPKPFPPMMKLPIQIIEGMGGATSDNYEKFRNYCFTAYITLRKSANLIINLFALMTESSIPDIMIERDKAVQKVMEKFCLEMTDAEAMNHFNNLINGSVGSLIPVFIDRLHNFAQYWRA